MTLSRARLTVWLLAASLVASMLAYLLREHDDSLTRLQAAGSIRIGYAVEPPYAFQDAKGMVTGEAAEIARRMAAALGIRDVEWRQIEFGELIDALETGRIDVIAAGMFITPERQQRVLFSLPTYHVRPGLLVARGNPQHIESIRQVAERKDLRVAVLSGAVEEQIMRKRGNSEAQLVVVPDALTGRKAVEYGNADALLLSEPTVRLMAQREQLGQTEMLVASTVTGRDDIYGHTAFAFHHEAKKLRDAWDKALRNFLGGPEHVTLLERLGMAATDIQAGTTP